MSIIECDRIFQGVMHSKIRAGRCSRGVVAGRRRGVLECGSRSGNGSRNGSRNGLKFFKNFLPLRDNSTRTRSNPPWRDAVEIHAGRCLMGGVAVAPQGTFGGQG